MAKRKTKRKRRISVLSRSTKRKTGGLKEFSYKENIIPYGSEFEIIATHNIFKSSNKRGLGISKQECDQWFGMVAFRGIEYKLFLLIDKPRHVTHNTVSHEVFHLVHRIMEGTGDRFSVKHQEPYAYLTGYITETIYRLLKKWKITVKN